MKEENRWMRYTLDYTSILFLRKSNQA